MTSKERIVAALHGRPLDRLPFCPFLAYVWESFPAEVQAAGQLAFHHAIGADPLWRGTPVPVNVWVPGIEVRSHTSGDVTRIETITPVGALYHAYRGTPDALNSQFLIEHPLKSEDDYKTQLWIEEHTEMSFNRDAVTQVLEGDGREGLCLAMAYYRGKTAFQCLIEHMVGTEELYSALYIDFPDTVRALIAAMTANNLRCAAIAAEAEFSHYLTFEDSSTQNYSPELYAQYIAPEITALCRLLKDADKYYVQHACGHLRHILPQIAECGALAVESLSPPPTGNISIAEARTLLGPRVGIIGGIEPTHFLDLSPMELGPYVEQVIDEARGGPFVLANSDSCPPGVTVEKFACIAQRTRDIQSTRWL